MKNDSCLIHAPIRPPRKGDQGEQLIVDLWGALMENRREPTGKDISLDSILYAYPFPVAQREADIAASLVCWFSTRIGAAFMDAAMSKASSSMPALMSGDRMLESWAVRNRRIGSLNLGWRVIEHILATQEQLNSNITPTLSMRDCEVCEHVLIWFGTTETGRALWQLFKKEFERITRGGMREDPDALITRMLG